MLSGENSRIIAKRVDERIQEIRKKLPPGVEIQTVYNRTTSSIRPLRPWQRISSRERFSSLRCFCFCSATGAALIVSSAIPLSFLFAITGMVGTKLSGNLMSLGAVDFGLIVDGAVVMVENIVRRLGLRQHELGRLLNTNERLHRALCGEGSRPPDIFRCVDHHHRLCPNPFAHRHRRKNVQADGAHRYLRLDRGAHLLAYAHAGAVFLFPKSEDQ